MAGERVYRPGISTRDSRVAGVCPDCGALVKDEDAHDSWHDEFDAVWRTVRDLAVTAALGRLVL